MQKGLASHKAWYTGDVSASPEQGDACVLAGVTCLQASPLSAYASELMEKTVGIDGTQTLLAIIIYVCVFAELVLALTRSLCGMACSYFFKSE